jgi:DNA invertase Pin-like site-specific DNA recombinase
MSPTYNRNGNVELEPAVAYLRKSTKGERRGRQKQEKSLQQQREEVLKLARGRFNILAWFEDDGVSGWKRGAARPDFTRMKDQAAALGARAVLCDHIDRFSRACYDDVLEDAGALRKAGVRWVVTCSHGEYDLQAGQRNDIAGIITFAAAVWAAHEYCKNLGRRVALARRNAAEEAKRTGGPAPYGLADDGAGGLVPGDPGEVEVVRWLFDQFVNHLRSLRDLAGELNARKVPPPRGKAWYAKTLGTMLRQPAYRGTFRFGLVRSARFFSRDADGEVVPVEDLASDSKGKVFEAEGVYEQPLVEPPLFDRAQERLAALAGDRGLRNRSGDYALTGVLVCGHCGTPMYGVRVKRGGGRRSPTVYKCNGNALCGKGTCRQYQVRESEILPFVLRLLGQEVADLRRLITLPPDQLRAPDREQERVRERAQAEHDRLAAQVARAEENLLELDDPRTIKPLAVKVSAWRDELERLEAVLAVPLTRGGYTREQVLALGKWWEEFEAKAVSVPVSAEKNMALAGGLHRDPFAEESAVLADPKKVNEALTEVGCEVRLRWRTEGYTSMTYKGKGEDGVVRRLGGKAKERHVLDRGRFRLGQRSGDLPLKGKVVDNSGCRRASPPAPARPAGRRSPRTDPASARSTGPGVASSAARLYDTGNSHEKHEKPRL